MKRAVVSDIHGNWEAWQAVLEDVRLAGVTEIYCLGDVVGYGPDPQACLHSMKETCAVILQGNHEYALHHPEETEEMNPVARAAIHWTGHQLTPDDLRLIQSWPLAKVSPDAHLVHGSPFMPAEFRYLHSRFELETAFSYFQEKICFCGHSHQPLVAWENFSQGLKTLYPKFSDAFLEKENRTIPLDLENRYIINVGSVGQPRDSDPRARWVLIEEGSLSLAFRAVPYDLATTQRKIHEAGLPEFLAERLGLGQ